MRMLAIDRSSSIQLVSVLLLQSIFSLFSNDCYSNSSEAIQKYKAELICPERIHAGEMFFLTLRVASESSLWIVDGEKNLEDKSWDMQVLDSNGKEVQSGYFHKDAWKIKPNIVKVNPLYSREVCFGGEFCKLSPIFPVPGEYTFIMQYRPNRYEKYLHSRKKIIQEPFKISCTTHVDFPESQ